MVIVRCYSFLCHDWDLDPNFGCSLHLAKRTLTCFSWRQRAFQPPHLGGIPSCCIRCYPKARGSILSPEQFLAALVASARPTNHNSTTIGYHGRPRQRGDFSPRASSTISRQGIRMSCRGFPTGCNGSSRLGSILRVLGDRPQDRALRLPHSGGTPMQLAGVLNDSGCLSQRRGALHRPISRIAMTFATILSHPHPHLHPLPLPLPLHPCLGLAL